MSSQVPRAYAKNHARGREVALLVLCHLESYKPEERTKGIEIFWSYPPGTIGESGHLRKWLEHPAIAEFARHLLTLLLPRWEEIDTLIEATSRSWRLARMDRVDRNILRLAVSELQQPNPPAKTVILAESVRLASRYGSETSAPFVNGIVNELVQTLAKPVDS